MLVKTGFRPEKFISKYMAPSYSLGSLWKVKPTLGKLAYAAFFTPIILAAPWFKRGDEIVMVARKE